MLTESSTNVNNVSLNKILKKSHFKGYLCYKTISYYRVAFDM